MFGKEAVCPDGLFVPAVFQESDFYLNSLISLSIFLTIPSKIVPLHKGPTLKLFN
jgi:hypothetical protein